MNEVRQDPWGDMPRWSDGEGATDAGQTDASRDAGAADVSAAGATETADSRSPGDDVRPEVTTPHECPWCATPAAAGAVRCATCGAALAQRESIGDLVIPGLTAVDPALKDLDGRPIHLRGPSPSQGVASGIIVAAAAGGPVGLAILGGVGAIAATEYLGAGGDTGKRHESVGQTSEAVLQAIERLDRGEALPTAADATTRPALASDMTDATTPPHHDEEGTDGR